jgi:hypothetical protein
MSSPWDLLGIRKTLRHDWDGALVDNHGMAEPEASLRCVPNADALTLTAICPRVGTLISKLRLPC